MPQIVFTFDRMPDLDVCACSQPELRRRPCNCRHSAPMMPTILEQSWLAMHARVFDWLPELLPELSA